jgi:GT2 family glycosyltransferase
MLDTAIAAGSASRAEIPVPPQVLGRWAFVSVRNLRGLRGAPVRIRIPWNLPGRGRLMANRFLRRTPGLGLWTVLFVPPEAPGLYLEVPGCTELPSDIRISLQPVSRSAAMLLISIRNPKRLVSALSGPIRTLPARIRESIATADQELNDSQSYTDWVLRWDQWDATEWNRLSASPRRDQWPRISVVVFHQAEDDEPLAATLRSLRRQWGFEELEIRTAQIGNTVAPVLNQLSGSYVAILQAGEVVPPHGLAVLADQTVQHGFPDALSADEDQLTPQGQRRAPMFKPETNHALILSGTLTQGIWLFRREALSDLGPYLPGWAEAVRLHAWLRLYGSERSPRSRRVPFLLAHRRPDTASAPASVLAAIGRRHLERYLGPAGQAAELVSPGLPLRWRMAVSAERQPEVCIVVPTAARGAHVTKCLQAVLKRTVYANFEIVIVVSQRQQLDDRQWEVLTPILNDARARVVLLNTPSFNYSSANNFGARFSDSELLCLLNDDVEPLEPRWLEFMAGHLTDPRVGAVGARLIYPNGRIQHGGVIMGLAGLCEHAFRHARRRNIGYGGRAVLEQELSAVTGACLLVRRAAFEALGGLDESYSISFNDVDFCLRLRESGWAIVQSAAAELRHHESVSLGHHFSGERAPLERIEVARMRRRWRGVSLADPFHNPNLSLMLGEEWQLAFPPRVTRPFGEIVAEQPFLEGVESAPDERDITLAEAGRS